MLVAEKEIEVKEVEKKFLNKSVIEVLKSHKDCSFEELVMWSGFTESQVREELSRQKESLSDDIVLHYRGDFGEERFYMFSEAKQVPIDLLNHFCNCTYQFRRDVKVLSFSTFKQAITLLENIENWSISEIVQKRNEILELLNRAAFQNDNKKGSLHKKRIFNLMLKELQIDKSRVID